jgi:hypothetical protein
MYMHLPLVKFDFSMSNIYLTTVNYYLSGEINKNSKNVPINNSDSYDGNIFCMLNVNSLVGYCFRPKQD